MSGKKLPVFLFLLFFFTKTGRSYAQLSVALNQLLPPAIKPLKTAQLSIEEKRRIVANAHDYSWNADSLIRNEIAKMAQDLDRQAQESPDTMIKVHNYATLGKYFYELGDGANKTGSWVPYNEKVIKYASNNPRFRKQLASAFLGIGMFKVMRSRYEEALKEFNRAFDFFTILKDTMGLSAVHACMYPLYSDMRLYHKAIEEQNLILRYTTAEEKRNGQAQYYTEENYQDKALIFLFWYEECRNKDVLDSALYYIRKSAITNLKVSQRQSFQYFLQGYYNYLIADYEVALAYIDSSLSMKEFYTETLNAKLAYKGISLLKLGKRAEAKKILLRPDLIEGDCNLAFVVFDALQRDAIEQNDFKSAVKYLTLANTYKDSLALITQRGKVFEVMQKHTLISKEKEIQELELSNIKESEKRNKLILAFGALFATMIAVIITLYMRGRERKYKAIEAKTLLEKEKRNKEDMILLQEREIQRERKKAILYLRKKISRDMHDELSSALAGLKYYVNDLRLKETNEDKRSLLESIEQEVASVYLQARTYMHNLHKGIEEVVGSLNPFLQQISTNLSQRKDLNIELKYDKKEIESKLSSTQQNQLTLMLKEATSNILKHSGASKIEVNISFLENACYFYIRDNGHGFENERAYKGLGLESMELRINRIKGRMVINSSIAGTKLEGIFPLI